MGPSTARLRQLHPQLRLKQHLFKSATVTRTGISCPTRYVGSGFATRRTDMGRRFVVDLLALLSLKLTTKRQE